MNDRNELTGSDRSPRRAANLSDRLDGIGWALFFIWVGIAFLADVGWGWGLLGIGIIILSEAAVRWYLALNIGAFCVACGLLFVVGGLWELFQIRVASGAGAADPGWDRDAHRGHQRTASSQEVTQRPK